MNPVNNNETKHTRSAAQLFQNFNCNHTCNFYCLTFQLRKLNELEDIVADQDNSLAALRDKLSKARQDCQEWRGRYDDLIRQHDADKEK